MHSVFRYAISSRAFLTMIWTLGLLALSACNMPANNGLTQSRPDAMPFADANKRCWEQAYGTPQGGGNSQFGTAMSLYDSYTRQDRWHRT